MFQKSEQIKNCAGWSIVRACRPNLQCRHSSREVAGRRQRRSGSTRRTRRAPSCWAADSTRNAAQGANDPCQPSRPPARRRGRTRRWQRIGREWPSARTPPLRTAAARPGPRSTATVAADSSRAARSLQQQPHVRRQQKQWMSRTDRGPRQFDTQNRPTPRMHLQCMRMHVVPLLWNQ